MNMGLGCYIVRKHCEWSFTFYLGLVVVKDQEVRRWGLTGAKRMGIYHVCTFATWAWGLWRFSSFLGLCFM